MNQPALYQKSHKAFKQHIGEIIKEYSLKFQWRNEGGDTLLDVGSGPGDVVMDYIYPIMPQNFRKIVCTDISVDMLNYAKSYYGERDKCEYKVFDVATTKELPSELVGKFDHVTSVLCLHWVQDQRTALENIFKLLRPEGGDCLLIFLSSHTIFDAYAYMSKNTKWSKYMTDVDRFICPLHYSKDAGGEFAAMMKAAGFCKIQVDLRPSTFSYGTVENFKENIKPVCGTLADIPLSRHDEFLDDFVAVMADFALKGSDINEIDSKCTTKYDLLVAHGRKAPIRPDVNFNK